MKNEKNHKINSSEQVFEEQSIADQFSSWITFSEKLSVGVFLVPGQTDVIYLNAAAKKIFQFDQVNNWPLEVGEFWSRLESMTLDPEKIHTSVMEAISKINDEPVIELKLQRKKTSYLAIHFFPLSNGSSDQGYGGLVIDRSIEKITQSNQVLMLEEMSKQARKLSAAGLGNIEALSGNLYTWNKNVVNEFLNDAKDQLIKTNNSLDMILALMNTIKEVQYFTRTVNLQDLLIELIDSKTLIDIRLIEPLDLASFPSSVVIDPSLTRMALSYLLDEMDQQNQVGDPIEITLTNNEGNIYLKFEIPSTLSLPGLSPELEKFPIPEQNLRLHLAKKIITTQGGSLNLQVPSPGLEMGFNVEIILPAFTLPSARQPNIPAPERPGQTTSRILLAEVQPEYQIRLRDALIGEGYRVDLATEESAALDMVQTVNPDLVLLARNMPGLDGLLVLQGIRRWSTVPIIMISERTNPDDLLYAYQFGVDDYLKKPFSIQELLARVQASLQRSSQNGSPFGQDLFQSNSLRIDYSARQVWARGNLVDLTPIEYNLLIFMSRQGKQIMPYEQLLDKVWDGPEKGTRQGLFVHVKRLRSKIEVDPKNPQIISNKWGVGYVFNPGISGD